MKTTLPINRKTNNDLANEMLRVTGTVAFETEWSTIECPYVGKHGPCGHERAFHVDGKKVGMVVWFTYSPAVCIRDFDEGGTETGCEVFDSMRDAVDCIRRNY